MSAGFCIPEVVRSRIDRALVERHPILLACVSPDGQPILSFRGSVQCHGDDALAVWIRNPDGLLLRSIQANPRVALMYRDEDAKATYQFQGRARLDASPAVREALFEKMPQAERNHDPQRKGAVMVVELDRIEGYAGLGPQGRIDPVLLLRKQAQG
ncbi:MAG: pyridoxamine 5'-phosphate oxidase family protein [Hylemonella sp.]